MLAERRIQGLDGLRWDDDGLAERYLDAYRPLVGDFSGDLERVETALTAGMTKEYFEQRKSQTNKAITDALGPQLAAAYRIHPQGTRPRTRFGLELAPDAIGVMPCRSRHRD
ncbi:hypothetical protein [Thiorhodococcus mannitoliphagus]|uniref:hypothetical protein n=1 Tax=Thiorhodococcus mannitoliphagus TaxID=329406 RepID=UPI001F0E0C4C|nr:hypothetical protein [Thiorhodococcus mannitoliphagus]